MQNMETLPAWDHAVCGRSNRKAGEQEQHGDDRRSQGRDVMERICPRRSGLEWQESLWNRLKPGKANDERRQSLGASRSCRPTERQRSRPRTSIAKLPGRATMSGNASTLSSNGTSQDRDVLIKA